MDNKLLWGTLVIITILYIVIVVLLNNVYNAHDDIYQSDNIGIKRFSHISAFCVFIALFVNVMSTVGIV